MSRSALLKQQGRVQEREERADELFQLALEEGRSKRSAAVSLPLWGPDAGTFHWNPLLLRNTIHSPYFQKCCSNLKDWSSVVDEIYYEVKHLMPFQDYYHGGGGGSSSGGSSSSRAPSTAFCLLLRLLTMRMSSQQMDQTLQHSDSPYIRGIGFLYLRYTCPPDQVWTWIGPYVQDGEEIVVETGRQAKSITIGEFVRKLFGERDYYGTTLPRYPIQMERDLLVQLLQAEKTAERAAQHFKNHDRMRHFQTLGSRIMALYGDDENPVEWYEAVVDRVISRNDNGHPLLHPKFVVTFTAYGNTETVTLGEVDVLNGLWKHDRPGDHGARGYCNSRSQGRDLYDEVRRRERDGVTADKGWARRPPTTKANLASGAKSGHFFPDEDPRRYRSQQAQRNIPHTEPKSGPADTARPPAPSHPEPSARKRSAEELAVIEEKKRRLIAKYG